MNRNRKGGISLRAALQIGCCGIAVGISGMAAAQEEASTADIVVTGSRVRGAAPVGSTVTTLGRAEMEASSAVTVDRMIKEIPQVFDLGVSENSRGQSGGSGNITYGNSVNLRGIGPYATLVIIDGHRVTNNSRSIDPSVLPSLGVERIEVVADGASAVYGSDAFNELEPDEQGEFRAKVFEFAKTLKDCPDVALSPTFFRLWVDTQDGPEGADAIDGTLKALETSDTFGKMKDTAKDRVRQAARARAAHQRGK